MSCWFCHLNIPPSFLYFLCPLPTLAQPLLALLVQPTRLMGTIRDKNILMEHKGYILNLYASNKKAYSAHNIVMGIKFHHVFLVISNQSAIWLKKWNINKLLQVAKKKKKTGGHNPSTGFPAPTGASSKQQPEWFCFHATQFTSLSCLKPGKGFQLHLE